jgi:hypothetical protein
MVSGGETVVRIQGKRPGDDLGTTIKRRTF